MVFSFDVYADQNDKRLDKLFRALEYSYDDIEMSNTISTIWNIWLEPNDANIENDFKQGLELMQSGKLETSIEIFTKVIKKKY